MKSEIQLAFENCKKYKRPALITYTVASDPNSSLKAFVNFSWHIRQNIPSTPATRDSAALAVLKLINNINTIKKVFKFFI